MRGLLILLGVFGASLGAGFGTLFIYLLQSPATKVSYSFFENVQGMTIVDVDNTFANWTFFFGTIVVGAIIGSVTGLILGRAGLRLERRRLN